MENLARQHGLKFQLWLSPITLSNDRRQPDLPKSLAGKHFDDLQVRRAYLDEVMDLAARKPEVLGLATEVNFPREQPARVPIVRDSRARGLRGGEE